MKRNFWIVICFGILLAMPLVAASSDDLMWVGVTNTNLAAEQNDELCRRPHRRD